MSLQIHNEHKKWFNNSLPLTLQTNMRSAKKNNSLNVLCYNLLVVVDCRQLW